MSTDRHDTLKLETVGEEIALSAKVLGDLSAQLEARFRMRHGDLRWRHWPVGDKPAPLFAWTTGRADGRYWSFAALPVGRGARSSDPHKLVIARDSWVGHVLRKDARLRAWSLRERFRAGDGRPWRRR
jgi:hypothetical protein